MDGAKMTTHIPTLFIPPIESIDKEGNEFVKVSQGTSVPLSSLPLFQRRSFVDQNVGTVPNVSPWITQSLIQIRRRQLRGEKDETEDDNTNTASYLSSGSLSTFRTSMSMKASDVGEDGQVSQERQEQHLAVHKAINYMSAALSEIDSLSHASFDNKSGGGGGDNQNNFVKSGFFDLLKRRVGSQLALLPIKQAPHQINNTTKGLLSGTTKTMRSNSTLYQNQDSTIPHNDEQQVNEMDQNSKTMDCCFRLKRKRQQLTQASISLRTANDRMRIKVRANQRTSEQLLHLRKAWRLFVVNFTGGRLIQNSDIFGVDCGLGEFVKPSINPLSSVELSIHPVTGNVKIIPHLKLFELELTLIDVNGKSMAGLGPVKLQDVLNASIRWTSYPHQAERLNSDDGTKDEEDSLNGKKGDEPSSSLSAEMVDLFQEMGLIQDGVLAHELFRMMSLEASTVKRWIPRLVTPFKGSTVKHATHNLSSTAPKSSSGSGGVSSSSSDASGGGDGSGMPIVSFVEDHEIDLCVLAMSRNEIIIAINDEVSVKLELKLTDKSIINKNKRKKQTQVANHPSQHDESSTSSRIVNDDDAIYNELASKLLLNCVLCFKEKVSKKIELAAQSSGQRRKPSEISKVTSDTLLSLTSLARHSLMVQSLKEQVMLTPDWILEEPIGIPKWNSATSILMLRHQVSGRPVQLTLNGKTGCIVVGNGSSEGLYRSMTIDEVIEFLHKMI